MPCENCAELERRIARLERNTGMDTSWRGQLMDMLVDKFDEAVDVGLADWLECLIAADLQSTCDQLAAKYPTWRDFLLAATKRTRSRLNPYPFAASRAASEAQGEAERCREVTEVFSRIGKTGVQTDAE